MSESPSSSSYNSNSNSNSNSDDTSPVDSSGKIRLRPTSSTRLRTSLHLNDKSSLRNLLLNDNKSSAKKAAYSPSLRRRCASTPTMVFRRSFSSSGNLSDSSARSDTSCKANAVMQIAQRSNGASVKTAISELQRHCDEHTAQQDEEIEIEQPLHQCAMLAQWSVDAYYKVLISKHQGMQAVISAMRTFPYHADLQAYCCCVLKNLSGRVSIQQAGGPAACIQAIRQHPHSIHLQSEAFQALRFQAPLILQEGTVDMEELVQLLENAKQMYLTVPGKESVLIMLDFFAAATPPVVKPKLSVDTSTDIKTVKQ